MAYQTMIYSTPVPNYIINFHIKVKAIKTELVNYFHAHLDSSVVFELEVRGVNLRILFKQHEYIYIIF